MATDDTRIADAAQAAGAETAMKLSSHQIPTERLSEVVDLLDIEDHEVIQCTCVVNVQGDETFIEPELIARVAKDLSMFKCSNVPCVRPVDMAILATPIHDVEEAGNPNIVKVVLDGSMCS